MMKCEKCGANLHLEDEKCPYCGSPNTFAVKHQQDMQYYSRQFEDTKNKVEKQTRFLSTISVKITTIAILVVAILVTAIFAANAPYHFWKQKVKRDIKKNYDVYAKQLQMYEENDQWLELNALCDNKNFYVDNNFNEYNAVYYASTNYKQIREILFRNLGNPTYFDLESDSNRVARCLDDFYSTVNRENYTSEYYDSWYLPQHKQALERMQREIELLLIMYGGLSEDEAAELQNCSYNKKAGLIEEGMERMAVDDETDTTDVN